MGITPPIRRIAWQRELAHYPAAPARLWYLGLTLVIAVALYSHAFVAASVLPLLQRELGLSLQLFALSAIVVLLVGGVGALFGSLSDRFGRANLVVYGSILSALLTMGIALTGTIVSFIVAVSLLAAVEGVMQVAMLALVRDFSPRLSRALALGFFSIGPWGGQILATTIASQTLSVYGTWQSQYVITGGLSLLVAAVAFFGLRELAPALRGQIVVSGDDAARLEAQAANFDLATATRNPWSQMLRVAIVISALGYGLCQVSRMTMSGFLPTYLHSVLDLPLPQANGVTSFFGLATIAGSLLVGFLSDRVQTRKPFMLAGALAVILALLLFMAATPATELFGVTLTLVFLSFSLAAVNVSWVAAFTETAEAINPALVGTALAIQSAMYSSIRIGTAAALAWVVGDGQGWATWWWVCVAGVIAFLPTILVLAGGWNPTHPGTTMAAQEQPGS